MGAFPGDWGLASVLPRGLILGLLGSRPGIWQPPTLPTAQQGRALFPPLLPFLRVSRDLTDRLVVDCWW